MHRWGIAFILLAFMAQSALVYGQTDPSYLKGEEWKDEAGAKFTTLYFTLGDKEWPNADPFRMVVIGDSIAWGCGLYTKEKYHYLVADWLQKTLKRPVEVTVLAHTGATITKPTKIDKSKHNFLDPELGSWDPTLLEQADHIPNPEKVDLILVSGGINDVEIGTILWPFDKSKDINSRCKIIGTSMNILLIKLLKKCDKSTIIVTGYYPIASEDTIKSKSAIDTFVEFIMQNDPNLLNKGGSALLFPGKISDNSAKFDSESRNSLGDTIGGAVYSANEYSRANFGKDRVYFASVDFPSDRSYGTDGSWLWKLIDTDNGGKTNDHKYYYRVSLCDRISCNWDDKIQAIAHPNVEGNQEYYSAIQTILEQRLSDFGSNSDTNNQPSSFEPELVEVKVPETSKESTQSPSEEWNKTFGGASDDGVGAGAYPMQPTADGGYILAGSTNSYGAGGGDAWLIKTDSDGNKIWEKNFGGANDDWANSVQQTSDGGYILAGGTQSFGAGGMDFWLIKTDAEGNKLWDSTFGGGSNEIANSVRQTSDGGYILAGAGPGDAWLIKTDSDGNKIWDKAFGGSNDDWAHLVQLTSDGGYILGGRKEARGSASGDAWIVKTDAEGSELWERTFGGSDTDMINSVQPTADGGYILAGWTYSYGAGSGDLWIIKTDAEGNRLWDKTFGGAGLDQALSVQSTSDNGYILAGSTESYGAGSGDAWLIKTDAEGNELWNKTLGGVNWDGACAGQPDDDGGYILVGTTGSYGAGSNDAWLIKVAPA
jgi:lysophospholipase L1-like esterase